MANEPAYFTESTEPKKKGIAYKVFRVKNGKLYPPMVANPGNEDTPIGVWLDAQEGEFAGLSKTGRPQVKSTGSGNLAYRPGWHLGDVPRAKQFDRLNKETGEYEFPKDFVWAECEYAMDVDYQKDSDEQGYMRTKVDDQGNVVTYRSDKYQHSLAGLPRLPKDGYYRYRTNPNPDTVPWVITGKMKVKRLLSDDEVNDILKSKGIEPIHRQGGDKTLRELGLKEAFHEDADQDIAKVSKAFGTVKEPFEGPSYILPSGDFLKIRNADVNITQTGSGDNGSIIHLDVQKWLNRQAGKDTKYVDDIDLEEKCIRVNTGFLEHYIVLPKERPNPRQMESLRDWIVFFYGITSKGLLLVSYYGPTISYFSGTDPDSILDDIRGYYDRGMSFYEDADSRLDEYFDEVDDARSDSPIFLTDEPYRVKSMLTKGDNAYRIYYDSGTNMFLIQDALGNQTHMHMISAAYKSGWIPEDAAFGKYLDTAEEGFMVFIPFEYGHSLKYHTSLGEDDYFDCRVYPFGVIYVRDKLAYENPLFKVLGKPEREIHYNDYEELVTVSEEGNTRDLEVGWDVDDPDDAIKLDLGLFSEGKDDDCHEGGSSADKLTEMKGKGTVDNERILGLVDECIEIMKGINLPEYFNRPEPLNPDYNLSIEYGDAMRTFGTFRWPNPNGSSADSPALILNKYMFDESDEAIKSTILHELCHYLVFLAGVRKGAYYPSKSGWMQNARNFNKSDWSQHGRWWSLLAKRVSDATGIDITRTSSYQKHTGVGDYANFKAKYIVKCKHCGREYSYTKMTNFIKDVFAGNGHAEHWWCNCPDGSKTHDFEIVKGK